jgi:hypothetical protein
MAHFGGVMQTKDLIVRCYVKKDGDLYIAVCIDLSLAAQANSVEEVVQKLEAQIFDYLCEAFSETEYAASLIQRKAPLSQRATFHWIKFLNRLKDEFGKIIELPLPMRPQDPHFGGSCKAA